MEIPTPDELANAKKKVFERMLAAGWMSDLAVHTSGLAASTLTPDGMQALRAIRRLLNTTKGDPSTTPEYLAFLVLVTSSELQFLD